ncbi:MAG TPA: family 20 glycosylhydrolase [Saprospiraceae bacterium]|nr:family 20 glycosylhydrolase [Saprospiraceae bacterium]HMP25025.1 family 20 glycosylhydrolase [Saprospiraceae bacterium]
MFKQLLSISFLLTLLSCAKNTPPALHRPTGAELALRWELIANNIAGENRYQTRFTLLNQSQDTLPATGWTIYFNQLSGTPLSDSTFQFIHLQRITGDFYRCQPGADFQALPPGDSLQIDLTFRGWLIKDCEAPQGPYIVFDHADGTEQLPELLSNYTITPIPPDMAVRGRNDLTPIPTPAWQYAENEQLTPLPYDEVAWIIPTPRSVQKGSDKVIIDRQWRIEYDAGLQAEAAYFGEFLGNLIGNKIITEENKSSKNKRIFLQLDPNLSSAASYRLQVHPDHITIEGADAAGVFYGIQSLLALLPPDAFQNKRKSLTIKSVVVEDGPRFPYRGLHLDVSRNFHSKATVLKILDLMAFYKLNKLHFHMADDEGWRLEIPTLPELTQVGARRGHTRTEADWLYPAYGSGPFPNATKSYGTGHYTSADFIEMLRHATQRHVEVIVEFDTPGHSRAAIKAMQARYERLTQAGKKDEATAYLLHDPDDTSVYNSAQNYNDNVMCICQEAPYLFWETVIKDLQAMYAKAGAPLRTVHIGGDEVPEGAWSQSPICNDFKTKNPQYKTAEDLQHYFLKRVNNMLLQRGLNTGGWEEIAMKKSGNRYVPNPEFADKKLQAYVWINLWGNQDMAHRLANAGFPVVLCNVTNLYFDLAYNKDSREPGLTWGGFVDARKPFAFVPEDIFKSTTMDPMGKPFDINTFYAEMESMTPQGLQNVLGIQAQLWSETIRGQEMLEYYLLPKLFGLAERAWAAQPAWAAIAEQSAREQALTQAWSHFANAIGQRELPRLDYLFGGWNYRIAPPGAIIKDGLLYANTEFPGLQIRYTTDGSAPTMQSILYEKPVPVNKNVILRTFDTRGRSSRSVEVTASIEQ